MEAIKNESQKTLYLLIDPEKGFSPDEWEIRLRIIAQSPPDAFLLGGSTLDLDYSDDIVARLRSRFDLPIISFPGDFSHVRGDEDGLFFLSLLSGRNPEFLINQHVRHVRRLKSTGMPIISTAYILIAGGVQSTVERVSKSTPLLADDFNTILDHCMTAELMGFKQIYLEAGSGAKRPIGGALIRFLKKEIKIPIIVGGGICQAGEVTELADSGADALVIGTLFEKDPEEWPALWKAWSRAIQARSRRVQTDGSF